MRRTRKTDAEPVKQFSMAPMAPPGWRKGRETVIGRRYDTRYRRHAVAAQETFCPSCSALSSRRRRPTPRGSAADAAPGPCAFPSLADMIDDKLDAPASIAEPICPAAQSPPPDTVTVPYRCSSDVLPRRSRTVTAAACAAPTHCTPTSPSSHHASPCFSTDHPREYICLQTASACKGGWNTPSADCVGTPGADADPAVLIFSWHMAHGPRARPGNSDGTRARGHTHQR